MEEIYNKHLGEVYDRLTIKSVTREHGRPKFVCECSCGSEVVTDVFSVLHKKTKSCGCLRKELNKENGKKNIKPAVEIGQLFKNKKGLDYEVLEYVKSTKVLVRFVASGYEVWAAIKEIKKGSIRDWVSTPLLPTVTYKRTGRKRKPRVELGDVLNNFYGCKYEVVEIIDSEKCKIKFLDEFGYEKVVPKVDARRGVRNPFRRSASGVGFVGDGLYNSVNSKRAFSIWSNMMTRCYDEESRKKHVTYRGCYIVEGWHCFQNFAEWCQEQPEFIRNEDWCLDKDIIQKGNKAYSPDKCSFVPVCINNLFTLRGNKRGKYPLGVHKVKYGKFVAQINKDNKRVCIGRWDTPEEAFEQYKVAKEEVIRELAEDYKGRISDFVYNSLINWNVEVTD